MFTERFAVIDLETTGNNKNRDSIIQLSIVFVENFKIIDQYTTFLSDDTEISPFIRELTNIEPHMLKGAPKFRDVADEVASLLDGCIFTAHNVEFDYGFLKSALEQRGIKYEPQYKIDTVELSKIFMPTLEKFQLNEIAQSIGITLSNAHRADEDARATAELLIRLQKIITSMNTETLKQLYHLSKSLKHNLSDLLFLTLAESDDNLPGDLEKRGSVHMKKQHDAQEALPPVEVEELYSKYIDHTGNDYREDQLMLANRIFEAFETKNHLAVEAYTGLGKTVAFLLASISYYSMYGTKTLISTSRKILQKQIITDDLAILKEACGLDISASDLKGRDNYLNLEAFELLLSLDDENTEIIYLKMKLLVWLLDTETGDLSEIHLKGPEKAYYRTMTIQAGEGGSHPYFERALDKARNSAIIITNHYFLPDCLDYVIGIDSVLVDEAHQLKNVLDDRMESVYSYQGMKFFIGQIGMASQERLLHSYINDNNETAVYLLEDILKHLNQNIDRLFGSFSAGNMEEALLHIKGGLKYTNTFLGAIRGTNNYQILYNHMHHYQRMLSLLNTGLEKGGYSIGRDDNFQKTKIFIRDNRQTVLENRVKNLASTILLSGTLEVNGSFRHLTYWFGELPYESQIISNPALFENTRLFIPEDIPDYDVDDDRFIWALVDYISVYLSETDSKLMVLFSNYELLDKVAEYTEDIRLFEDYAVLKQSRASTPEKLLAQFNQLDKCLLLGTSSFNEGINIESAGTKCLMLTKLPFPVPTDKGFKNFYKADLPEAVFSFRQIAGRVHRQPSDKGLVLLFDRRILTRNYKKAFLKYFPEENIIHGPQETFKGLLRDL